MSLLIVQEVQIESIKEPQSPNPYYASFSTSCATCPLWQWFFASWMKRWQRLRPYVLRQSSWALIVRVKDVFVWYAVCWVYSSTPRVRVSESIDR